MEVANVQQTQLSNDINVITAEIKAHQQIAGQSIFEIGKRLKHVKENDLAHGQYINWVENVIGMDRTHAFHFIKIYEKLDANVDTYQHLGSNALYLIATLPEEERQKEHTTSKGEVKTVDEMTVKELKELKKQLKQKDEKIEKMQDQNNNLQNKLEQTEDELQQKEDELQQTEDELQQTEELLNKAMNKPQPEPIIIERVVEKDNEVTKEMFENYKLLSEELKYTQQKLEEYEKGNKCKVDIDGNLNNEANAGKIIESHLPQLTKTLKVVTKEVEYLKGCKGGWKHFDRTTFNEFVDAMNTFSETIEALTKVVNDEIN